MNRIIRLAIPLAVLGALPGCGDSPETLLNKARGSFAAQDYQAARMQLASALLKQPDNPEMLALMARTQLRLGDPDGAEGALARLAQTGVKSAGLPRMKAEIALLRKKPEDALALLGNDASIEGWRIRAQAQLAMGDDDKAAQSFERGMAAGDDIRLAEAYARYKLVSNDLPGAAAIHERMRRIAPKSYETLVLGGDLAAALGRTDRAIDAYRQAIDAYPDRVAPMLALANQYDAKGKLEDAARLVEQAGKIAPDDPAVEALKYQLMSEKGEWEKIRLGLQGRESDLEPGSGLQMTYAEALLRLGYAEQARVLFNRAVLTLPGNPYSRMMLGEAQLASGDADGAWATLGPLAASTLARPEILQSAEKAARAVGAPEAGSLRARLEPARLKANMALIGQGEAALTRRDWPRALAVYGRLLQQGHDPEVLKRMALAASGLGRAPEAIGYADQALAALPDNPDYLYLAGLVRLNGGQDLAAALRLLEAAATADPRNPVIARDLKKAKAAAG
ncbi:Tetratricopeptide repeat-containing protein [Novosphingobium sp. CF614]|uniref:tetratricopeptide repeat protein n=1 Tax=Novosphingobium sp. CF614 TaxID=1884364 RepID=UPI0008F1C74F|nr:tetratricopeptide repeat protein [Novosphingobium sp. CF614]SFG13297.1 Tetratricopeptide repeat-containing protein [Novosphingobium sp. CF614]